MTELLYLIAFEFYLFSLYLVSWYYLTGWWKNPTILGGIIQVGFIITGVGIYLFNRFALRSPDVKSREIRFVAGMALAVSIVFLFLFWIFFQSHPVISQVFDHWVEIIFFWLICIQFAFGSPIINNPIIPKVASLFGNFLDRYGVILIFFSLTCLKIGFLPKQIHNFVVLDDTYTYWQMAKHFLAGDFDITQFNHYPPLYPIALIPALWFNPLHIYQHTTILNSIYSSTTVFPLYLLARQFFSKRMSLFIAFTSIFYLYHLIFPGLMMSENISLPLFLWAVYFSYAKAPSSSKVRLWDILLGISIGLFWLSRYLALPLVPVFMIVRYLRDREQITIKNLLPDRPIVKSLAITLGVILGFEAIWIVPGLVAGVTLQNLLGFQIASNEAKRQLSFPSLLFWLGISVSYLILMAIPVLPAITRNVLAPKAVLRKVTVWQLAMFLFVIVFLVTVTRHALRAGYNADEPIKFVGRYIFYLSPLLWLSAFQSIQNQIRFNRRSWLALVLTLIFFGLAYFNLFHPGSFILDDLHPFLSPDMVVPWMIKGLFIFQVFCFLIVFFISLFQNSKLSALTTLISFLMISNLSALGPVQKYTQSIHRNGYLLDAIIENVIENPDFQSLMTDSTKYTFLITDDLENFPKELEVRGLSERISGTKMIGNDPLLEMNCRTRIALQINNMITYALITDSDNCKRETMKVVKKLNILSEPVLIMQLDNIFP